MKIAIAALLICLASGTNWADEAKKSKDAPSNSASERPEVNPYGKSFRGDDGQTVVEMALFSAKNKDGLNDVLLKITGPDAVDEGIEGKVLKYTAVNAGTGVNFNYTEGKKEHTRMLSRSPWGDWKIFQLFLGKKTINLSLDPAASQEVRPLHLLTAYRGKSK